MVLDTTLLSMRYYKVRIKGKVEESKEWNSTLIYTFGIVAIENGAFWSPSTKVTNLYAINHMFIGEKMGIVIFI